jgi:hypothetical protein
MGLLLTLNWLIVAISAALRLCSGVMMISGCLVEIRMAKLNILQVNSLRLVISKLIQGQVKLGMSALVRDLINLLHVQMIE